MNANTIVGYINGTKRNQIAALTLTALTESAILVNTDTGTTAAVLAIPLQTAVLGSAQSLGPNGNQANLAQFGGTLVSTGDAGTEAPYFNSSSFDLGRPFRVRVSGTYATSAGAANPVILYLGTSGAIVGTLGNRLSTLSLTAASTGNFIFDTYIRWDSVTAAVSGYYTGQSGNAAPAALTFLTNAVAATTPAALSFVLSVNAGAASVGTVTVSEFSISQE